MNRFFWPLIGFALLVMLLAIGLRLDPQEVPSPLIGKPAPEFSLPRIDDPQQHFSPRDMLGKVWLLNVWATWCVTCRQEHPVLVEMANRQAIPLIGINYKEVRGDVETDSDKLGIDAENALAVKRASGWLNKHGNPYQLSVLDLDGRVGIDYGVYGVPETYLIDRSGIIRLKHTGPMTPEVFTSQIQPLIKELSR